MKKNRRTLMGIVAVVGLAVLMFALPSFRPTTNLAQAGEHDKEPPPTERAATLNVKSAPAGVTMLAQTCFTVSSGTCGTTNWTSTNTGGIPATSYQYPTTAVIGGTSYSLDHSSLTGCNQGTSGSPVDVCEVSVAAGATGTISATYKVTPPPPARVATLNVQSSPAGVVLVNQTCYTVSAGTCGTTNWTSTSLINIPATSFQYPTSVVVNGTTYWLNSNSLTGCNVGTAGTVPDICNVSVAIGSTATISASYSLAPTCAPKAQNLVLNNSFEMVANSLSNGTGVNGNGQIPSQWWYLWDYYSTSVPHWFRTNGGFDPPLVINNDNHSWPGITLTAFDGSKFVRAGFTQGQTQHIHGIVGELSSSTNIGKTYLLTARVATLNTPHTGTFKLRLRNASSIGAIGAGVDSVPAVETTLSQTTNWTLISGTVTANAPYNRVALQYNGVQPGFVDDVHVCEIASSLPWWERPVALAGVVLMALSILGGLTTWLLRTKTLPKLIRNHNNPSNLNNPNKK